MQIPFRTRFSGFVIYEACTVPLQQYYYITGSLEDVRPLDLFSTSSACKLSILFSFHESYLLRYLFIYCFYETTL